MKYETALAIVTAVATTTATTGCYSTWDVAPRSLSHLDTFRQGQTRQLERADSNGEEVLFNADTELRFVDVNGAKSAARLSSVDLQGPVLVGVERRQNAPFTVDLTRVAAVQARNFSVGKTVGLSIGLGIGVPVATFGLAIAIIAGSGGFGSGRPLRVGDHAEPVRARLRFGGRGRRSGAPTADGATRARLLAHWASEASAECASVPAFLALARDLRLASAPAGLVDDALRAAREEATHTALCVELAGDHASLPLTATTPPTPPSTDVDPQSLLVRLATEALWDGCVAEGVAAAVARRSALIARDEATHRALSTIAHDEQGHAELARQVVACCLSAGGRPIRDALVESFEAGRAAEEARIDLGERGGGDEPSIDEDFARKHGLVGNDVVRAARVEVWEKTLSMIGRTLHA